MGSTDSFIRGEYTYADKIQVVENVPTDIASAKVSTFNGSLGFGWSNGLELIFWGRNLFNDEYLLSAFPSVAQAGSYSGYPNQPRTYGVTLAGEFLSDPGTSEPHLRESPANHLPDFRVADHLA